jgi:hypothetical protein
MLVPRKPEEISKKFHNSIAGTGGGFFMTDTYGGNESSDGEPQAKAITGGP